MDDKEAEIRANMRLGKLDSVGRLILYSDTRASNEQSHWEVVDVSDLKKLPSYVSKDRQMTKDERTTRQKLLYTSGVEHSSRIFARVSGGESSFSQ